MSDIPEYRGEEDDEVLRRWVWDVKRKYRLGNEKLVGRVGLALSSRPLMHRETLRKFLNGLGDPRQEATILGKGTLWEYMEKKYPEMYPHFLEEDLELPFVQNPVELTQDSAQPQNFSTETERASESPADRVKSEQSTEVPLRERASPDDSHDIRQPEFSTPNFILIHSLKRQPFASQQSTEENSGLDDKQAKRLNRIFKAVVVGLCAAWLGAGIGIFPGL